MKGPSRIEMTARRAAWAGLLLLTPLLQADAEPVTDSVNAYEVVGQVLNTSPLQSLQYGYLNWVRGLDGISTTDGTISEATAMLTFYNDTATERVINNGPVRVVDRTGTSTIYLDSGGGDFSNPDSFRKGKPVQVCSLRHQVVIDTSSGYFTTTFEMTITAAKTFQIDGKTYRLGRPGGVYRLTVFGKLSSPAPPSAYIAGVATGFGAEVVDVD